MISLISGIFIGMLVLHHYNPLESGVAFFEEIIALFAEDWITKTLVFMLMVGSIIKLLTNSGAIDGFIAYLGRKAKTVDSPRGAMLLAYVIGIIIFVLSAVFSLLAYTRTSSYKEGVAK